MGHRLQGRVSHTRWVEYSRLSISIASRDHKKAWTNGSYVVNLHIIDCLAYPVLLARDLPIPLHVDI